MSDSIETVVTECWRAWNAFDHKTACSYYADDGVHKDLPLNRTFTGPAEVLAFWEQFLPYLKNDDWLFDVHTTTLTEDRFTVEWTWHARLTEDFIGLKSGKFALPGVSVGTVKDGKITYWCDYYSLATMLVQLGQTEIPAEIRAALVSSA